jgi:CHAT domain-containing protein
MKSIATAIFLLLASLATAQSSLEEVFQRLADCNARDDQPCVIETYKQYAQILKETVGTENEEYQSAVVSLVMLLMDQGQFSASQPYLREIILFTSNTNGAESEEVQQAGMAFIILLDAEKSGREKDLFQQWLGEQFPHLPPSYWEPQIEGYDSPDPDLPADIDLSKDYSIDELLALLERYHEGVHMDSDGAEASFEQLIPLEEKIIEKMEKELRGRHPRYVEVLFLTANAYTYLAVNGDENKEHLLRSNALLDKALAHTEKSAGKQNEDYLLLLNAKGGNFAVAGEMEQYVAVLEEMLAIMKGFMPKDDEFYQQTLQMYTMLGAFHGSPSKAADIKKAAEDLDPEWKEEMPVSMDMLFFARQQTEAQARAEAIIPKMSFPNLLDSFLLFPGNHNRQQVVSFFEKSFKRLDPALFSKLDDDAARQAMGFLQQEFEALASFTASAQEEFPELRGYLLRHVLQFSYLDQVRKERLRQRLLLKDNPKFKKLFAEWADQKSKVNRLYEEAIYENGATSPDLSAEEARLKELEKQLSQAVDQTYSPPPPPKWENLRSRLKEGETFVEIKRFLERENGQWTSKPAYLALIVHPGAGEPDLVIFHNAKALDYELYQAYQNSRFYGDDGKLYRAYFEPIAQRLQGAGRVYLSADGVFHKINLNTLKIPGAEGYLLDRFDIQLTGSMLTLLQEQAPQAAISSALLIGDPLFGEEQEEDEGSHFRSAGDIVVSREMKWKPLPWSKVEIEKTAELLQQKGIKPHAYLQDEALKSQLGRHPGAGIVHLATHAWFSPITDRIPFLENLPMPETENGEYPAMSSILTEQEWSYLSYDSVQWSEETIAKLRSFNSNMWSDPRIFNPDLNSGIVFSGEILSAYEIYGLDLSQAQLVVLSACNSGVSDLGNGRGVTGLRGAFELAGANYIINTLWEVKDDVAQTFMLYFYENWLGRGQSIDAAFRNAQLQIRKDLAKQYPDQSRADLWGAFVLIDL